VSPDIAAALVSILAHTGDENRYKRFVDEFKNAPTPQEEDRFMYALAMFRDEHLLKQTLEKTLNGEVRTQNAPYLVAKVLLNPSGREVGWTFIKENWKQILKTFPEASLTRMIEGVTGLCEKKYLDDVESFLQKNEMKQGKKTVEHTKRNCK